MLADVVTNLEQLELWEIEEAAAPTGGRPRNPGLERFYPEPIATSDTYPQANSPP